jgi:hypothetical protein
MRLGITLTFEFALAGLADTAFSLAEEQKVCSIEGNTPGRLVREFVTNPATPVIMFVQ